MGEFDQTIVNTYLTGVIMSQFFTYWNSKFNDSWWLNVRITHRSLPFLFIINITQAAAVVYMTWFYCVT
ncbi:hypothetical protein FB451DRAFT_1264892 [Mycena latifolia]|nr:hypothetical protein FB451DRAFT_1264892 [Mycena latifolia]